MAIQDEAIVLRLSDYSESSQIVTLYTREHGLARLIAKGVRRATKTRHAVGVDLLEHGDVTFVPPGAEAGLGKLHDWRQRNGFAAVRSAIAPLHTGLYAIELVAAVNAELDPHPTVYAGLLLLLTEMEAGGDPLTAIAKFQATLLRGIGLAPNMRGCVGCGRERADLSRPSFSSHAGGLLCERCGRDAKERLALPRGLFDATPAPASWLRLLNYHLAHIAGRRFRAFARVVDALDPQPEPRP